MNNPGDLWQALSREGELAAEHLAIGATALGKAHFSRTAYYAQTYFALSVGFERCCKLALTLDAAFTEGQFLSPSALRGYGHDLAALLADVESAAEERGLGIQRPRTDIHDGIIATLSEFATNVTRYYNLEVLSGRGGQDSEDPIAIWHTRVTQPVLRLHYSERQRSADRKHAAGIVIPPTSYVSVHFVSETGEPIRSLEDFAIRDAEVKAARRWERMYVLQLARFVGTVVSRLGELAQAEGLDVPFLHEFFEIFSNDDEYFLERTTWSIHH